MEEMDLKLLAGEPIYLEKVGYIYSPSINEIKEISEKIYNQYVSMIMINKESIDIEIDESKDINNYDIIFAFCLQDESFLNSFKEALSFFLKDEITFFKEGIFIIGEITKNEKGVISEEDNNYLTRENYVDFAEIIRKQNCIKKPKTYNAANSYAQKMIDKIKKNKQQTPRTKDDPTLADIVSSIYWKSSKSKEEIWSLTIYELYNGLQRLNIIDNYSNTMTGVYTGNIDTKKTDLKKVNWMKPIRDEEE